MTVYEFTLELSLVNKGLPFLVNCQRINHCDLFSVRRDEAGNGIHDLFFETAILMLAHPPAIVLLALFLTVEDFDGGPWRAGEGF